MRLKDKVAIVTGGAHGMGEAEARLFAKEGAAVVISDVLTREGEAVAAEINTIQGRARFVRTDVTLEADWQALIAETISTYGRLDILVNNAGISGSAVGDPDGLEGWEKLLSVNAASVFLGTKLAAAAMMPNGRGSIVNISSIMGFVGSAESHPGYAASKGAVRLYTKSSRGTIRAEGRSGELGASWVHAADAERDECGGPSIQDRGDAAAAAGGTDRGRLWRAVPGVGRGVVRYGDRAGDRRRLYRAIENCGLAGARK